MPTKPVDSRKLKTKGLKPKRIESKYFEIRTQCWQKY